MDCPFKGTARHINILYLLDLICHKLCQKPKKSRKLSGCKLYSLDGEKIECVLGKREIWFLAGQVSRECCIFISDVGILGIYLFLTLGAAKFKFQLDLSCSLHRFSSKLKISVISLIFITQIKFKNKWNTYFSRDGRK